MIPHAEVEHRHFFFFFLNFFIGFQLMTIVYDNCTIYH